MRILRKIYDFIKRKIGISPSKIVKEEMKKYENTK